MYTYPSHHPFILYLHFLKEYAGFSLQEYGHPILRLGLERVKGKPVPVTGREGP
jgi:hypothetical protein